MRLLWVVTVTGVHVLLLAARGALAIPPGVRMAHATLLVIDTEVDGLDSHDSTE